MGKGKFLGRSPSKTTFRHRIHSLLRRVDARGSSDITYRIWRISPVTYVVKVRLLCLEHR